MSKKHFYIVQTVEDNGDTSKRLVRAANRVRSIRHVWNSRTTAEIASNEELHELGAQGVKVEEAE